MSGNEQNVQKGDATKLIVMQPGPKFQTIYSVIPSNANRKAYCKATSFK